jgi:hypothetical protein
MRTIVIASVVLCVVLASGKRRVTAKEQGDTKDKCAMLYTDEDARRLIQAAEKAVPAGRFLAKNSVLKALSIDPSRLCNRRVHQFNLGYVESWQLSKSFDLTWGAAVQDPTPLERDDRKIFHVRILKRSERPNALLIPQDVEARRPGAPAETEVKPKPAK